MAFGLFALGTEESKVGTIPAKTIQILQVIPM